VLPKVIEHHHRTRCEQNTELRPTKHAGPQQSDKGRHQDSRK
jgi:hypothetical protein